MASDGFAGDSDIPYLSVVVTARNDDHGGNLLGRMQLFLMGLVEQCSRHRLRAELIVVEWNPPTQRPKFAEALFWPAEAPPCGVRIIEVPPDVHQRLDHADALPLFQMIAKNVGIRRSRGEFVLATNVDILFSEELMAFLASGRLDRSCMYRVDRYDVDAAVPADATLETRLIYCRDHVTKVSARDGDHGPIRKSPRLRRRVRRRLEKVLDGLQERRLYPITTPSSLHTNACGDFTLLAREKWFALRGYTELCMSAMHIDSLLCHAAYHSGVGEVFLADPMRIYHIEHGTGQAPEGDGALNARLGLTGIPRLSYQELETMAKQMRRRRMPTIFNTDDWGLATEVLREIDPVTGRSIPTEPRR